MNWVDFLWVIWWLLDIKLVMLYNMENYIFLIRKTFLDHYVHSQQSKARDQINLHLWDLSQDHFLKYILIYYALHSTLYWILYFVRPNNIPIDNIVWEKPSDFTLKTYFFPVWTETPGRFLFC